MALCKLVRRNYSRKLPVSIKYENLHSFKEEVILWCQNILETRRITHLHGSAFFTIPLTAFCSRKIYIKGRSDFQTKGLKREREWEREEAILSTFWITSTHHLQNVSYSASILLSYLEMRVTIELFFVS